MKKIIIIIFIVFTVWIIAAFIPGQENDSASVDNKMVTMKKARIIQYGPDGESTEMLMDAEKIEQEEDKRQMRLYDISGTMVLEDNSVMNFNSDQAIRDGYSRNIRFVGNVSLISPASDIMYNTQEAFYDFSRKLFYGDHKVKVIESDMITTGEGFEVNTALKAGELKRDVKMEYFGEMEK